MLLKYSDGYEIIEEELKMFFYNFLIFSINSVYI